MITLHSIKPHRAPRMDTQEFHHDMESRKRAATEILRKELMQDGRKRAVEPRKVYTSCLLGTRPSCAIHVAEFFVALAVLSLPVWASWAFYFVTGHYMNFGG